MSGHQKQHDWVLLNAREIFGFHVAVVDAILFFLTYTQLIHMHNSK